MIINNTTPISRIPANPAFAQLFADVQANVLKAHGRSNVHLLFLNFGGDKSVVRNWLAKDIATRVTSFSKQLDITSRFKAEREFADPGICTFSISNSGFVAIGINQNFGDDSFKRGLNGSIPLDPPIGSWDDAYQNKLHALVILANTNEGGVDELTKMVQAFKAGFPKSVSVVAEERGQALPGEKEHFGFADGISQPRFFIEDMQKSDSTINWNPFASLDLALVKDPLGRSFSSGITGDGDLPTNDESGDHGYGSFLVFRKLEQDVDGWNKAVVSVSTSIGMNPGLFGAYAVGRFQDGTPVVLHGTPAPTTPPENDFDFQSDKNGMKCPFHSHIRKSNPRGDTTSLGATLEDEKKHRISRRGIPYATKDNKKGLLFMCYQSSITSQFEFMQNAWVNNTNFVKPNTGNDSTIGEGPVKSKQWPHPHGGPQQVSASFDSFVKMRGGEYFFTPSISTFRNIGLNTNARSV